MYKIKVSGYYRSNKDMVEFEDTIKMPECEEEWIQSNVQNRVLHRHFQGGNKPFTALGKCYIDKVEKDAKLKESYLDKNIKELDWDGIQELAIKFNLRKVPLFRATSLRQAREVAYIEYCTQVLGKKFDDNFKFESAPEVVIKGKKDDKSEGIIGNDPEI